MDKSNSEQLDIAHEQLEIVRANLRAERKIINRDWAHMTPRERSSQSRIVKELEQREQSLIDEIEMNRGL